MTTPMETFEMEKHAPVLTPLYFVNESGLRVNAATGELMPSDPTHHPDPYLGSYGA